MICWKFKWYPKSNLGLVLVRCGGGFIAEMGRVRTTEEEGMGKTVRGMKDHFWGKGEKGEREKAFHLMAEI